MTLLSDASSSNGSRPDDGPGDTELDEKPVFNGARLPINGAKNLLSLTPRETIVRPADPVVEQPTADGAVSLEVVRADPEPAAIKKATATKRPAPTKKANAIKKASAAKRPAPKKAAASIEATDTQDSAPVKKAAAKRTATKASSARSTSRRPAARAVRETAPDPKSSTAADFDQIRWQRAYDRTAVEAFRASVEAERARLTAEIESARERVATLRQALAGRSKVRSEVTALVSSAQRELAELDKDYQELLTTIRARGEAEAARILTEARTEAAAIQSALGSLAGLQSQPAEASLPAWLTDPRLEAALRQVQPRGA